MPSAVRPAAAFAPARGVHCALATHPVISNPLRSPPHHAGGVLFAPESHVQRDQRTLYFTAGFAPFCLASLSNSIARPIALAFSPFALHNHSRVARPFASPS